MNCSQCGIEPPANSAFCNGCGATLDSERTSNPAERMAVLHTKVSA